MRKNLIMTLSAIVMTVCSCDSFEYHPYASEIYGRKNIHAETIEEISLLCNGRDTICFAFLTDTQGSLNEMEEAVEILRKRENVMFVVHGGDQSDFGLTKEFLWCRDLMENIRKPYVCLLGNHDCLGNGEHVFEVLYGNPNFSFNAGFVHFVGLNTVALEYDYSHPVPDFTFMEDDLDSTLKSEEITSSVVLMHAPPYDEQFNNNIAKVFHRYVTAYPGLRAEDARYAEGEEKAGTMRNGFCINGHTHHTDVKNIFNDGVLYYGLENMEERAIQIYTITKEGYEVETINF